MKIRLEPGQPITLAMLDDPFLAAILLSLFTDARADDAVDPRGWWGDALDAGSTGSLLWQMARGKKTVDTLRKIEDYASAALAWMVKDGLAKKITVLAAAQGETLHMAVIIDGITTDIEVLQ